MTATDDMGSIEMYTNADIVYKAADSMMISAAKWSCFDAPGIRDTRKTWVTMMMVEEVVVPTDNAIEQIWTALLMGGGIQAGHTKIAKYPMPVAESNVRTQVKCRMPAWPMEVMFKMSGTAVTFQQWLDIIQQRQTYIKNLVQSHDQHFNLG
jgi:hypothetical protein